MIQLQPERTTIKKINTGTQRRHGQHREGGGQSIGGCEMMTSKI